MRAKVILALLSLMVCALPVIAQQKLKIEFAGDEVGNNVYITRPDGSFSSETTFEFAGTKIESSLTGKITAGALAEFEFKQTANGKSVTISAKGAKAKISAEGETKELDYKPATAFFANLHPFTLSSIASAYDTGTAGTQKVKVFVVDGVAEVEIGVTMKPSRTVELGGEKQVVQVFSIKFPSVEFDAYVTESSVVAEDVPLQRLIMVSAGYENLLVDPATLYPELSQPTLTAKFEKSVKTPMRDAVELAADVVRPAEPGKYPAILIRTPYGREASALEGAWWAKRGYVLVSQDVRGRGGSAGDWLPFFNERKDGYDTIEWITKQPWSNGKVGMMGGSYLGWVQWQAAVERHPALKCIIPQVSPPDPFYNFPFDHGIPFLFGAVWWSRVVMDRTATTDVAFDPMKNMRKFQTLPITKVDDEVLGRNVPFIDDWWKRETASAYQGANFFSDLSKVNIPALHVSGWWDGDGIGTKMNYAAMRALRKDHQYLIYGPWTHAFNTTSSIGDVDYGPDAILELNSFYLRWFDRWLKDKPVLEGQPKVRVFLTGANEWRNLDSWPASTSKEVTYYFSAKAPSNGKTSAGELITTRPGAEEPDRYTYNPAGVKLDDDTLELDPSKAKTSVDISDEDQSILIYKTAPLKEAVEIGGPIEIDLYFSTSAVDTDFFVALMDEDTKGVMRLICMPGKMRAKFYKSFDKPELLKPGRTYKLTIPIWDTAHRFENGHRIAVSIQSEMFPIYARNLNTGEPAATGTRMTAAHQTIYHDAKRPSALRMRVLPPKG